MRYRRERLDGIRAVIGALLLLLATVGCQEKLLSSKWAMDDPDYATKYSEPYGSNKNERMLKQMVDARHVEGKGGWYGTGLGSADPRSAGLEVGLFNFPTASIETRVGLQGLVGTREDDWYLGATPGIRLQAPTRLAPFVGVASFIGGNWESLPANNDRIDNDDDGSIDEYDEEELDVYFRGAIGPEVGVHYWLNGSSRLTVSGQHLFSTEGRSSDMWMFGVSFSVLTGPNKSGDDSLISRPKADGEEAADESNAAASLQLSD